MTIQFKTDRGIEGCEEFTTRFVAQISEELRSYDHQINKIRVYLCDAGHINGTHSNSCSLEAMIEGQEAFEILGIGDSPEQAVDKTMTELKRTLNVVLGNWSNN